MKVSVSLSVSLPVFVCDHRVRQKVCAKMSSDEECVQKRPESWTQNRTAEDDGSAKEKEQRAEQKAERCASNQSWPIDSLSSADTVKQSPEFN